MNERIKELARQSGATDENGSRATTVFCFTEQELKGFAELIVRECQFAIVSRTDLPRHERKLYNNVLKEHFGVES
jgi:hypothetical protein